MRFGELFSNAALVAGGAVLVGLGYCISWIKKKVENRFAGLNLEMVNDDVIRRTSILHGICTTPTI